MSKCDAGERILVRLEVTVSKGHGFPETHLARKAKVGFCPCSAKASHIAVPTRYRLGAYSGLESSGLSV